MLCLVLATAGCATTSRPTHPTKHVQTHGSLCDLYVQLDGTWTKFSSNIGDYRLIQSPDGRYLLLTDYRGTYQRYIRVYDTQEHDLFDITPSLRGRFLPSLSGHVRLTGTKFCDNRVAEFEIELIPKTQHENSIAKAMQGSTMQVDVHEVVEVLRSR